MIAETSGPRAGIQGPARVFFPPNMNVEKGYRTVLDAAEAILGSEDLKGSFKPILRYVPRENTPAQLTRRAEAIMEMTGGEVLDGVLSDDAFKSVTLSADIIAITYTVKAFSRRMSGSLTDALMTAKPIVATRGTYVGDQVERFGCGEVFDEGDVEGLIAGLKKIRDDYPRYHAAAIAARRKYFKERSWDALHRRLTQ
jgi:glycosyltransferase involved in cell wall biosynthesis